jgi:uncharacterized membrane protein YfcA
MLQKIITSNWVAIPVFGLAAGSLVLLYVKGRTLEAIVGACVLAVALILMILGREKKN